MLVLGRVNGMSFKFTVITCFRVSSGECQHRFWVNTEMITFERVSKKCRHQQLSSKTNVTFKTTNVIMEVDFLFIIKRISPWRHTIFHHDYRRKGMRCQPIDETKVIFTHPIPPHQNCSLTQLQDKKKQSNPSISSKKYIYRLFKTLIDS